MKLPVIKLRALNFLRVLPSINLPLKLLNPIGIG